MVDRDLRTVVGAAVKVLIAAAGVAALAGVVALDAVVLRNGVAEGSLTEILQEFLLVFSVLAVGRRAWRDAPQRGFAVLMAGLFGAMLIREMDGMFDRTVMGHGSWKIVVSVWLLVVAALTFRNRATILGPMADYSRTHSFTVMMVGLLIVLVYSRLLGMGKIWIALQEAPPLRTVKNVVEEGVELLGYGLVAYAAVQYEIARHRPAVDETV